MPAQSNAADAVWTAANARFSISGHKQQEQRSLRPWGGWLPYRRPMAKAILRDHLSNQVAPNVHEVGAASPSDAPDESRAGDRKARRALEMIATERRAAMAEREHFATERV